MESESIQQIKQQLQTISSSSDKRLLIWKTDKRIGVQKALIQWEKKQAKQQQDIALFQKMCEFENCARQKGYQLIAGIDEVGRGPLAGPVVAAAVILPENFELLGINDSKQLSEQKRNLFFDEIQQHAVSIGVGIVNNQEIDTINIYQASKQAMIQAINKLAKTPDYLLIDAMTLDYPLPQENIIKGDARSISIAAASIIAKVTRDQLMKEYDQQFPGYGFGKNAGYGTKEHLMALKTLGITPIHRRTFAPIKDML